MRVLQIFLFIGTLIACVISCENRLCGCSPAPGDPKLSGRWELVKIKYGLTGVTATAQQAGYTETLTFSTDGSFQRIKDGQEAEKGAYNIGTSHNEVPYPTAIVYNDKTIQPYQVKQDTLFLYERGPANATVADGSTYTYHKL